MNRRRFGQASTSFLLAAIAAASSGTTALGQAWPSRPVTMIVTTSAGGAWDGLARLLSEELSEKLGQKFIVENRGGAGGNIAAAAAAKANPDGYTFLLMPTGVALNKLIFKQLQFDPQRDFTPIVLMVKSPHLIAMSNDGPAKNLNELIAYAKANPGKLTAGTAGIGTTGHITLEALQNATGVKITHVPYQATPSVSDLLGGRLDIGVGLVPSYASLINDGRLRGIAVTSGKRSDLLPNVPTMEEAGLKGFESTAWNALVAPAGTPRDVVRKINEVVNAYLASERGREKLRQFDLQPVGGTPESASAFISDELSKWGPIIKQANIQM
jgi:tripartite-type tricarboxylate transporter receptor subunit TctC